MTTKKRKLLYALIALLLLLIILVVGWLTYLLFSFHVALPPSAVGTGPLARLHSPMPGPGSEILIQAESPLSESSSSGKTPGTNTVEVVDLSEGFIPCVCEGYGPKIRSRDSFKNPLTYHSEFSPTRTTITVTIPSNAP